MWDPKELKIPGGYRYILGGEIELQEGKPNALASSTIFSYSSHFIKDYLPRSIELGRSFVRTDYQQAGLCPQEHICAR